MSSQFHGLPAEAMLRLLDLKPLLDIRDAEEGRVSKTAPTPAPGAAPAPAPAPVTAPTIPPAAAAMNECQVKNIEKHQAAIDALWLRRREGIPYGIMAAAPPASHPSLAAAARRGARPPRGGGKLEHDTPAYKALIQKHSYIGDATVFGHKYAADYAPLISDDGRLTGALFVAVAK